MPANLRIVPRGTLLFEEDSQSLTMFYIQSGTIRLFKRKQQGAFEIALLQGGELVGELGFLDGATRSTSAEALTDTVVLEISRQALEKQMGDVPEYIGALLRTLTGRLRNSNNRLKFLESNAATYIQTPVGERILYIYISNNEYQKSLSLILLAAARFGYKSPDGGTEFPLSALLNFGEKIFDLPRSKIFSVCQSLEELGHCKIMTNPTHDQYLIVQDLAFIDELLTHVTNSSAPQKTLPHETDVMDEEDKLLRSLDSLRTISQVVEKSHSDHTGFCAIDLQPHLSVEVVDIIDRLIPTGLLVQQGHRNQHVFGIKKDLFLKYYKFESCLAGIRKINRHHRELLTRAEYRKKRSA